MMLTYDATMAMGADTYADVLTALRDRFGNATFTQTGGMCAALEIQLEGAYLLIGDAEDSLSWDRSEQCGWGVVLYPGTPCDDEQSDAQSFAEGEPQDCCDDQMNCYCDGPRWDNSTAELFRLIAEVMSP